MSTGDLSIKFSSSSATSGSGAGSGASPAIALSASSDNAAGRLSLRNISKRFGKSNVSTIDNVSLDIAPGEFVVVVGPSGCGKTTLLNIAAGMIRPDKGTATLDGKPIKGPGPDRSMVFQDHGLFPWLTAEQNVEFGLKMAGVPASERRDRVAAVLKMVHLSDSASKLVHELSGGMRQRISIARALVMNPAVLLMDEPFAALDAQTRTSLHQELQDLWLKTRRTILFVTHSVGEAVRLADRIVVLHSHPGRIRREFILQLPHPRAFDSSDVNELIRLVRKEIKDEVNRVNGLGQDAQQPEEANDLGSFADDMGSGI
jgi:NitT/TauT family transport system ATP-binding protein